MPKVVVFGVLVGLGLLVAGLTFTGGEPGHDRIDVKAYFAYPATGRGEDDQPEDEIINRISDLGPGDELKIASYSFTDDQIAAAVLRAWDNGASIKIYQENSRACRQGADLQRLFDVGIPIRVDTVNSLTPSSYRMHNKFMIINSEIVITGSYNWTDAADTDNWENIVVIESSEIGTDYEENFDVMWENYGIVFTGCE